MKKKLHRLTGLPHRMAVGLAQSGRSSGLAALLVLAGLFFGSGIPFAQQEAPAGEQSAPHNQGSREEAGGESPAFEAMAEAVTRMAERCDEMMGQKMKAMPVKMIGTALLGLLLTIALVLFIILEVHWIRFWRLRVRIERAKLPLPGP